ncbi:MAG: right-handed parallel beta-helix repeat-containing protein [Candidatus Sumerlaeia bacterium]
MFQRLVAVIAAILASAWLPAAAAVWNVDDQRDDLPSADFTDLSAAIAAAADGDTIIVQPGFYYGPLDLRGRRLHLRSRDPLDADVAGQTVVDGQYGGSVVLFRGTEPPGCIIEGFTLTHGLANYGGCIHGGSESTGTLATIRYNVIRANVAFRSGGGLYRCSGAISNNTVEMNVAGADGGGFDMCGGPITGNIVSENEARRGGGLYACAGVVSKNIIRNNWAEEGGGAGLMVGEFTGNLVLYNGAYNGGGLSVANGSVHDNVIRENEADQDGGGIHGANGSIASNTIYKNRASRGGGIAGGAGTISGNVIEANWAEVSGGAVFYAAGLVRANRFEGNAAGQSGGAMAGSSGSFERNAVRFNSAGDGGAFAECTGPILANTIQANRAASLGGALWRCGGRIHSNLFESNAAARGGALALCHGSVLHNTVAFNSATTGGALLLDGSTGIELRNNIFHENSGGGAIAGTVFAGRYPAQIVSNCFFGNAPIAGSARGAEQLGELSPVCADNFTADPRFVRASAPDPEIGCGTENDYRLGAGSPCADRATWHVLSTLPAHDLDGLGRVAHWQPDLGCYERGAKADADGDGLDDDTERSFGTRVDGVDTDGDGLSDALEVARRSSPLDRNKGGVVIVPTDWPDARQAVLFAFDGDLVVLNPGTYYGPLDLGSRAVRFRSRQPYLPGYATSTFIDAIGQGPALRMDGIGAKASTIEGLTIRNGRAARGGAILAGAAGLTLNNCIIADNAADAAGVIEGGAGAIEACSFTGNFGLMGGCLAHFDGIVRDSAFEDNYAAYGGVFYGCESTTVTRCVFRGNAAGVYGGVAFECFGQFSDNTFEDNEAEQGGCLYRFNGPILRNRAHDNFADDGGALFQCHGLISENLFDSNSAYRGAVAFDCDARFIDNDFVGNDAVLNAGALMDCDAIVRGNRFEANTAFDGGVMVFCSATVEDNSFLRNEARNSGGVMNTCGGTLARNTFEANRAVGGSGGVLCIYYGDVTGNTLRGNTGRFGGAITVHEGTIDGNLFEANSATDGGAVMYLTGSASGNRFIANTATGTGGALSNSTGSFLNNIFSANGARYGGAMQGCRGAIAYNTIFENTAEQGGGLYNCYNAVIANNIIYGNTRYGVYYSSSGTSPTLLANNCFHDNAVAAFRSRAGAFTDPALMNMQLPQASGNIGDDPRLISDDDLHLRPDSPCVDAGYAIGLPSDFDGIGRPLDGDADGAFLPDIGAYEFYGIRIIQPAAAQSWHPGDTIEVRWQSVERWAGASVRIELWRGNQRVAVLGEALGAGGTARVVLPDKLPGAADYRLRVVSIGKPDIVGENPVLFTIAARTCAESWWNFK